ncbi:MAG TPA: lipocalin-like domain-containing protein [Anaeromyxobacter sp.]|nr:lipocalin-like domain-containing protein [Anaeromyxobacter sp.]
MRSSLLALALAAAAARPEAFRPADPAHRWEFPRDHHAHPGYRTEWWYLTGSLEDAADPSRRFGFQLTFFRLGLAPRAPALDSAWAAADAVMAHLAVTDVAAGTHHFSEVVWRATPLLGGFPPPPDALLAWARAPAGTGGRWTLSLEGGAFRLAARDDARGLALELSARPAKPVALQGPNGLSRKSADARHASLYASITRLATEGTLAAGGRSYRVRGESWMDQEVGSSQLAPDQVGWDWWSLRLADGRDLMMYVLRRADGAPSWRTATLVERDGRVRVLGPEEWSVRSAGTWTSPATRAVYPAGWDIAVPGAGVRVTATPLVAAAENVSALVPGLSYWEGPVGLTGAGGVRDGDGYVELTGYTGGRLPL